MNHKKMIFASVLLLVAVVPSSAQQVKEVTQPTAPRASYVIGVDDVLSIHVWGEPELNVTVKVRPDGFITLPLIQDVPAHGRTTVALREDIVERLRRYIREPNVSVTVEEINNYKVYVLGEVRSQGVLTFTKPTRLLQALAAAGGLSEFSKKEATLVRSYGAGEQRMQLDLKRIYEGQESKENIMLAPGDVLLFR
ncbi:MAG: polysaccharide biosynthesis/export family protein [Acidobacteriota bacterium]|nr:MAG: polysaccharide biosynthesis/export family protein [Acidobacteriota bacterium]